MKRHNIKLKERPTLKQNPHANSKTETTAEYLQCESG